MKHLTETIVRLILLTGIIVGLPGCVKTVSITNTAATTSSTTTSAKLFTQWQSKTLASDAILGNAVAAIING